MEFPIAWMGLSAIVALLCAVGVGSFAARFGFPVPDERFRSGNIDGLRGYLALLVMASHFSIWTEMTRGGDWHPAPGTMLSNFGVLSVTLFFMITGFLFYPKVAGGFTVTRWRALYVSRVFRIIPLQFVVLVVVSLIALARQGFIIGDDYLKLPIRAAEWMTGYSQPDLFGYHNTGLINAFVLWSLRYEWTFYLLVLPVLALLSGWRPIARRPFLVPAAMIATGYIAHRVHPGPLFLDSLMAFGFGILSRLILDVMPLDRLRSAPVTIGVAILFIGVVLTMPNALDLRVLTVVAMFFLCIAAGNRFGGIVTFRGALVLGECSFGIYMLHGIVLNLFFVSAAPLIARQSLAMIVLLFPLLAIAAVLVAILAFLCVERPMIRLGRRVATGRRSIDATATAPATVSIAP
jgi:peptidoglycan/LPS O-acetylase OafA/YrhL